MTVQLNYSKFILNDGAWRIPKGQTIGGFRSHSYPTKFQPIFYPYRSGFSSSALPFGQPSKHLCPLQRCRVVT